jgi:hypothetical protein
MFFQGRGHMVLQSSKGIGVPTKIQKVDDIAVDTDKDIESYMQSKRGILWKTRMIDDLPKM